MGILELCHAWNRGTVTSNALSPSTRRRKLLAWSSGENDSSPWTPVCTLTSVLKNTFKLAQRIPGQPGRHSTGCVHRLAGQEWTCQSGAIQTKQRLVTVASGRPCNIYWSAPWWTLPALLLSSFVFYTQYNFSPLAAHAFACSVTVAKSSAVQASSSGRQERRWASVCGSSQSQSTDWESSR